MPTGEHKFSIYPTLQSMLEAGKRFYLRENRYPINKDLRATNKLPSAHRVRAFFGDLDTYRLMLWKWLGVAFPCPVPIMLARFEKAYDQIYVHGKGPVDLKCLVCGAGGRTIDNRICPTHHKNVTDSYDGSWMNGTPVEDYGVDLDEFIFD